jgi:dihydroorotate dehydrogenase (NAD+) catalytic subunit
MLAAGTAGTLSELADVLNLARVGAVVTKSITAQPRDGNQTWRILPTDAGMLNAIGLANVGVDAFVRDDAPRVPQVPTTVIASVAGYSVEEYCRVVAALEPIPSIPAIELNVSCPNVHGGCEFSADPEQLSGLIREVRPLLKTKRLFVKLSPIASGRPGMVEIARAAIEPPGSQPHGPNQRPGADALCISNTIPAMAIDVETRRPRLANVTGGLSGPAVHNVAVKLVHDVYRGIARQTGTALVGIGGVSRWEHAAEFILAGASAVQVGTALFADPKAPLKIAKGLGKWCARQHPCLSSSRPPGCGRTPRCPGRSRSHHRG